MARTYQAKNFTGQQLDDHMGKILSKSFAGHGLRIDEQGTLHATGPGYGRLVYSYVHQSNKEVHPQGINLATGEFTATAHGLENNVQVFVAMHAPHHLIATYDYLPGGLLLGQSTGSGKNSQYYYVKVVDANTFTLSKTSGGATEVFTEVSTMDLSKFHFEVYKQQNIDIKNLPNLKELLVVIKGRMSCGYRYCIPIERANPLGKNPIKHYDAGYSDEY